MGLYTDQTIWIVGASSGIGRELSLELASRGAKIAISGRREDLLESVGHMMGVPPLILPLDVTSYSAVAAAGATILADWGQIDRIIVMAGVNVPGGFDSVDAHQLHEIVMTNILGVMNVCHWGIRTLNSQKSGGQLAVCASVAGYVGLPMGQPYCATKAAIINLMESLRVEFGPHVDVKVINPGFVKTPLTDKNTFKMPFLMDVRVAAHRIADELMTDRFEIHFPKMMSIGLKLLQLVPYFVLFWATKFIVRKGKVNG